MYVIYKCVCMCVCVCGKVGVSDGEIGAGGVGEVIRRKSWGKEITENHCDCRLWFLYIR